LDLKKNSSMSELLTFMVHLLLNKKTEESRCIKMGRLIFSFSRWGSVSSGIHLPLVSRFFTMIGHSIVTLTYSHSEGSRELVLHTGPALLSPVPNSQQTHSLK